MRTILIIAAVCVTTFVHAAELPTEEAGAIAYLTAKGVEIKRDADGHAVRLTSGGKPAMTAEAYALIGLLPHLEQMGLNAAPLEDDEWGFLRKLPKLRTLSIWHGHAFTSLKPFSGLQVESLTIGGCMGLRNLHRDEPEKFRDAVLTLEDLPKLESTRLYHSPMLPGDDHIAHLVEQAPHLEKVMLDFAAPRGFDTTVTPQGLGVLAKLPLVEFGIENAQTFGPEHFRSIAKIETLRALLVDARRKPVSEEALTAFRKARPDVELVVAGPDAKGPPRATRER